MLGDRNVGLVRASADAGFRSYWRTLGAEPGRIVMDSPPDKEDVKPWLRVRAMLEAAGVRVPKIFCEDDAQGFLVMEDLGPDTYLHVLHADNADDLFDAAIDQLLKMQAVPVPDDFPKYDQALLLRELRLFDEWFLGRHLAVVLGASDEDRLDQIHRVLIDAALAQPQVFVHRDFMPRNLMPAPDGPAVLDFQDAVRGPIAYDALCLFKDAFVSWPQARVDEWLDRYHARAQSAGLPVPSLEQFRRDVDFIGVHRHLKVIGIFARLHHRDNKSHYLEDVPRFFGYLDRVLPKYPELAPLADMIDRLVAPALKEYAHWTDLTGDEP
ncbi:putative phosphotransferase family protein [Lysobacter dokdonensis DS-58]|uniref:Putative phosphotransferase family protein n=2 Tax=Noviluteimonas TaxID=3382693 RepID=A0A0A2WCF1_9GAMM|nr:putative phosphotransferase family protein [Lysobacter dokdonensis DS-58]